jgi:membrane protease YdiL (CAAX protease family)
MINFKIVLNKYPVLTYLALTLIISWGAILIVVGPGGIPITAEQVEVLGVAMLLGPSVACILLTGLASGRIGFGEILSRLLRWRVDARWYAVALLTAPLSTAAVLLALSLLSPEFLPLIFTSDANATPLMTGIAAGLIVGFFEELGWTGFAVPRLRLRYSILTTGLIVGLMWGAWHFILFWERTSFSGALAVAILLARLFSWLPAYRTLMVWVYDRTGSLFVAMLMHVSLVASTLIVEPTLTGGALLTYILIWAAVLWIVIAAVAVAQQRAAGKELSPSNFL